MAINLTGDISIKAFFEGVVALHQESNALGWVFIIFIITAVLGSLFIIGVGMFYRIRRMEKAEKILEGQNEHRS